MAVHTKAITATPMPDTEKFRSVNTRNGTSGSPLLAESQNTNTAIRTTPAANIAQIHRAPCWGRTSCSANTLKKSATPDSATPITSNHCRPVGRTGISQTPSPKATKPMGTLTKKIHCQSNWSMSTPPTSGPASVATPTAAPRMLVARPRCSAGKMRVIIDRTCGVSNAAPTPWTTRAATSIWVEPDSPHHNDAAVKMTRPIRYTFFGPYWSPRRPATNSGTAKPSKYALVTQTTVS